MTQYEADFYARNQKFQAALGKEIVPFLIKKYHPRSVIDFGCGCGQLLSMFKPADVTGLNGDRPKNLKISDKDFHIVDLSKKVDIILDLKECGKLECKHSLVISLEVAEHLPEASADTFIRSLVDAAAGPIMFSAATPGQGGVGHVNEQPHEYWHKKFKSHGYKPLDIIRPILKGKKSVPFWYRRNIFIYEK